MFRTMFWQERDTVRHSTVERAGRGGDDGVERVEGEEGVEELGVGSGRVSESLKFPIIVPLAKFSNLFMRL